MRVVADVDRLSSRPARMDDSINPFEHRDVDCSGRSLATLLVAWVGAAMVASVLLRWKYMWIALTILTLLFLFACGYAACNARRAQERAAISEEARILDGRTGNRNIQSVSGSVDNYAVSEPPAYDAYWITDLPPPYAVVIGSEPPTLMPRSGRASDAEPASSSDGPRLSNPPPYSVAILSEPSNMLQTSSSHRTSRVETSSSSSSSSSPPALPSSERAHSTVEESTSPRRERVLASTLAWDEDKNSHEQPRNDPPNSQMLRPSGTQYLSNIISCTFGIGQRRTPERNSTAHNNAGEWPDTFQSTTVSNPASPTSANVISATTL